jgi:hypothetical protein
MALVSLLTIRIVGEGAAGLAAATAASLAVYLPIVYPMRAILRQPPHEPTAKLDRTNPA